MEEERDRPASKSGFLLIAAAIAGLIWANSPFAHAYETVLHAKIGVDARFFGAHLTLHEWINDGLMAVFFLVVGMEIKREVLGGELASWQRAALPAIAAFGGVLVPASICAAFVWHDPARAEGWAIPAATDIAFALALLTLAGSKVANTLRVFLTALAVIDDLAAIAIIVIFYTSDVAMPALLAAIACLALLVALNRFRVRAVWLYLTIGAVMWFFVLESGVHATLAGVALAFTIPRDRIEDLEHRLLPWVAYGIVPLFGLFNAGVSFAGINPGIALGALPLGIAAGLFIGKQVGIFAFSWLAVKLRIAPLPAGANWAMMYGLALLGGIGFTMSLFIGSLAFSSEALLTETKIGVFGGSILAAIAGFIVLRRCERRAGRIPA